MTTTAPVSIRRDLADMIARQAEALARGTFTGPEHAMVKQLLSNVETLVAWTPDDRSGA